MSIMSQLEEPPVANGYRTEQPGLVRDTEAGDPNKTDGPGQGREGHSVCHMSTEWEKAYSGDKDQERPPWKGAFGRKALGARPQAGLSG